MRDSSPALPPVHPLGRTMVHELNRLFTRKGPKAAALYAEQKIAELANQIELACQPESGAAEALESVGLEIDDLAQMIRYLAERRASLRDAMQ